MCAYVRASVCGVSNDLENKNNHRALVAILNKHNVCIHSAILDSLSTQFFYCALLPSISDTHMYPNMIQGRLSARNVSRLRLQTVYASIVSWTTSYTLSL